MKTLKYANNEQGIAMLLEVLLIALVLTAAGAAVYTVNNHSKLASQSANVSATPPAADGNVEHAATALTQETSVDDASVNNAEDGAVSNVDAASNDESDMNVSGGNDDVQ